MAATSDSSRNTTGVTSVKKAFTIVESLAVEGGLGITELSNKTNLNKSTVHRLLTSLRNMGYLQKDDDTDKYRLTYKLLNLTSTAVRSQDFVRIAHPYMEELAEHTRETVHLAILDGTDVFHVDGVDSRHSLTLRAPVGTRLPAHATALGKALLAEKSDEELDELYQGAGLQQFTPNTIDNLKALKRNLRTVRKNGFATDQQESERGLCCLSAAFFDNEGTAIAAISISAPCARLRGETLKKARDQLLPTVEAISYQLGARAKSERV